MSLLLLGQHDLEAVKVGQVLASFDASELLGNFGFSELGFNTGSSPDLSEGLGASATGHVDLEGSQAGTADSVGLAGDFGALDEDAVEVNDFQDAGELASELAFSQEDNAADFNEKIVSL